MFDDRVVYPEPDRNDETGKRLAILKGAARAANMTDEMFKAKFTVPPRSLPGTRLEASSCPTFTCVWFGLCARHENVTPHLMSYRNLGSSYLACQASACCSWTATCWRSWHQTPQAQPSFSHHMRSPDLIDLICMAMCTYKSVVH